MSAANRTTFACSRRTGFPPGARRVAGALAFWLLLVLFGAVAHAAAATQYDKLTTTNGVTYLKVTVSRIDADAIYVTHQSGGTRIALEDLPANVLKDLGLPPHDELQRRKAEARQRVAAAQKAAAAQQNKALETQEWTDIEQQAKGLVKYQGQWLTPAKVREAEAQKREQELGAQAAELVSTKARKKARFKVTQLFVDGALCRAADRNVVRGPADYNGELFFLLASPGLKTDEDAEYTEDLYWAGTNTYLTVRGEGKTINAYSVKRDLALRVVRFRAGLRDPDTGNAATSFPTRVALGLPLLPDARVDGFGSGFIVTKDGYILTNRHVVDRARRVKVRTEDGVLPAQVVAKDSHSDLALIKVDGSFVPATLAADETARLGQTVFTVGFPMPEVQGFSPKVTKGVISSLNGVQDDVHTYQIDAAVQPGNSGGPLADERGNVVGVVVARLNDAFLVETTGTIAQNVNYSVKKSFVLDFLAQHPEAGRQVQTAGAAARVPFEEAVERVRRATVMVMVGAE